jgi:hypothetical protein
MLDPQLLHILFPLIKSLCIHSTRLRQGKVKSKWVIQLSLPLPLPITLPYCHLLTFTVYPYLLPYLIATY